MKVILFGATGMVGHGAMNAALTDKRVTQVLAVGRRPSGRHHPRLRELVVDDLSSIAVHEASLRGFDTCLFCLGVSAAGLDEANYRRVTYDLTMAVARTLARLNPDMRFVYVSGAGTDVNSRRMWARVKGETERAIAALGFRAAHSARPGYIQPVGGARSRTALYRALYAVAGPLYPLLRRLFPRSVIDSDELGRALLQAGLVGAQRSILEVSDLRLQADANPTSNNQPPLAGTLK